MVPAARVDTPIFPCYLDVIDPGQQPDPASLARRPQRLLAVLAIAVLVALAVATALLVRHRRPGRGPVIVLAVHKPGASPASMQSEVAWPLTEQIGRVKGLLRADSVTREGAARITLTFSAATDPHEATASVRKAIRPEPLDALPVVRLVHSTSMDHAFLSIDRATAVEVRREAERLRQELERKPGVREVRLCGGAHPAARVVLDEDRLASLGLDAARVLEALHGAGAPGSPTLHMEDLRSLVLTLHQGAAVKLGDVATLRMGAREDTCRVHSDREGTVVLEIAHTEPATPAGLRAGLSSIRGASLVWSEQGGPPQVAFGVGPAELGCLKKLLAARGSTWVILEDADPSTPSADHVRLLPAGKAEPLQVASCAPASGRANELHELRVQGPAQVDETARRLAAHLRTRHVIYHLRDEAVVPTLTMSPDREALARHGVSLAALRLTAELASGKLLPITVDGAPLHVEFAHAREQGRYPREHGRVRTAAGSLVPVDALVRFEASLEPGVLRSQDRSRYRSIVLVGGRGPALEAIRSFALPLGTSVELLEFEFDPR